jgi:prepilin peptidase CpaA
MLATLLLIALVLTAAITDAARHRIYNWTTYPGMLAGLVLAGFGAVLERIAPESAAAWQPLIGWLSWTDALGGFLVCGCLMVVCFVFFPMGGGDVKLLAMVGALAGLEKGLDILLWTFVFGGCLGLIILIWKFGAWRLLKLSGQMILGIATLGTVLKPPTEEKTVLQWPLFLGPCAAAALAAALVPWPWIH